jgi:PAS domain-containing protein
MAISQPSTARAPRSGAGTAPPRSRADATPLRAPNLAELETLVTCAAEGSIASAATILSISRPAVAKRIANLEALAGRPLLRRDGNGVKLTNAGAKLVAATPPIFHQREILLEVLGEIRNEGERSVRLRELLGHAPTATRAAQRPEARLTTAECLLEFIVATTSSAVVLCSAATGRIAEANGVFCSFVGRSRDQILGTALEDAGIGFDGFSREEVVTRLGRDGALENLSVFAARADGSSAEGSASARLVPVADSALMAIVVDERRQL